MSFRVSSATSTIVNMQLVCYDTVIAMSTEGQFEQLDLDKSILIRRDYSDFHSDDSCHGLSTVDRTSDNSCHELRR